MMSKQGNARHFNPATFLFERSKSNKALTQEIKKPNEETENQVINVKTPEETATTSKERVLSYKIRLKDGSF